MPLFMSEEEAIALIDENMDQIEARMASGTSNVSTAGFGDGSGTNPCGGGCDESGLCCNCCLC